MAPLHDIRTLAIVCPSWVGDTVMATPVFRACREQLPGARIIGVMRRGLDDVLRGTRWMDEMHVCDMPGLAGMLRLAKVLRGSRPQAALLLPNSFKSALAARLSGAGTRVGYDRDRRGFLLTHRKIIPRSPAPMPAVEYYLDLARFALGVSSIDARLELAVTDDERQQGDRLLHDVQRPFVLLNPGANRADKRWPAERFAAAADVLAASLQLDVVVNGSPGERDVVRATLAALKSKVVNLAERGVTLGSLKAVIQRAAVMITNDTGPRHIAAAIGTPVVTLFGPTDHRWTTLNYSRERLLLAEPFLSEELVADRHPKMCRIERIAVRDVVRAADALLTAR